MSYSTQETQIVYITAKRQQAFRDHRLMLQCTPEEFYRRHPGTDATFMAFAAGTSLDTVYNWGVFWGRRSERKVAPPQIYHQLLLGEASKFLRSL